MLPLNTLPLMARTSINAQAFLANLPLFRALSAAELARIATTVTQLDVSSGTMLFRRGEPCVGFHVVIYGQVKLALPAPSGDEKVVEVLGPGQSFGEAVMFLEKPYLVQAQALADTKLLFVPRETVFAEIDAHPGFARRMLASLSARLHRLVSDVEAYALHSGRERVIGYLLSALPEGAEGRSQCVTLATRKGVIASRLSITQEHFSRILHELSAAGIISVHGREILVQDVARLRAHAAP